MIEETTAQFLYRRRRELAAQISALRGQLAPKEAELAQIDQMLALADPRGAVAAKFDVPPQSSSVPYATQLEQFLEPLDLGGSQLEALSELTKSGTPLALAAAAQRYDPKFARMTIKELVVQAIVDHFPNGGKSADIREFIRNGYGREIDQASLRPQMHRLKADTILTQDGEIWNLDLHKRTLYAMYDHPTSRAAMKELQDETLSSAAKQTIAGGANPTPRQQRFYGVERAKQEDE